jgi:hypothetical protein
MSKTIKLEDRVKVYATKDNKYAKEGVELSMHPELAAAAEKAGWVTKSPAPKPSKKEKE